PESLLLRGDTLDACKTWVERRKSDAPEITTLLREFFAASEVAEKGRTGRERQQLEERVRLLRRGQRALALIAMLVVIGGGAVFWQYRTNLALQRQTQHQQANLLGQLAAVELLRGNIDGALRFSAHGARFDLALPVGAVTASPAAAQLAASVLSADWRR